MNLILNYMLGFDVSFPLITVYLLTILPTVTVVKDENFTRSEMKRKLLKCNGKIKLEYIFSNLDLPYSKISRKNTRFF